MDDRNQDATNDRPAGLTEGYGGSTGVGNPRAENATAARFDPDDLGSTAPGSGLTAGGTGTSIDEDLIADTAGDGIDDAGQSDPAVLGMGMDDSPNYLDDSGGDTQA